MDRDRIAGLLVGLALGDALGLPREGLSRARARRLYPGPLRHAFLLGRGVGSDDTDHACMTVQAWLATSDADGFARSLGWRLRGWFLGLPAGIGLATLRACGRLLIGFPPSRSGVWSAGNGPAMRAPALALVDGDLRAYVRASTRITHTDPKAEVASYVLALAARQALRGECDLAALRADADDELGRALDVAVDHLARGASAEEYADAIGLADGVTGYIHHTVPAALYAWARHRGDFRATVTAAVDLGGDTDSVGAVAGALAGATVGLGGLPGDWLGGFTDRPRSVAWITRLADAAVARATDPTVGAVPLAWPWLVPRNLLVLVLSIGHVLARLPRR